MARRIPQRARIQTGRNTQTSLETGSDKNGFGPLVSPY
jgi:hypothetical protein